MTGDQMTREECVEAAGEDDLLFADGYDEAIIGIGQRFNETFVVYDKCKVIAVLVREGMTIEDAEEFFNFNVVGAYVGNKTPAFMWRPAHQANDLSVSFRATL